MALEAVGSNPITHPKENDNLLLKIVVFLCHRKSISSVPLVLLGLVDAKELTYGTMTLTTPEFFALSIVIFDF